MGEAMSEFFSIMFDSIISGGFFKSLFSLVSGTIFQNILSTTYLIGFFIVLSSLSMAGKDHYRAKKTKVCYSIKDDFFFVSSGKPNFKELFSIYSVAFVFSVFWVFLSIIFVIKEKAFKKPKSKESELVELVSSLNDTTNEIKTALKEEFGNGMNYKMVYLQEVIRIAKKNEITVI